MKRNLQAGKDQPVGSETVPGMSRRMVAGSFAAIVAGLAGSGVGLAATGGDDRKRYMPELGTDYATTDPPFFDPVYPSIHFPHVFMSQGKPVQSFMWLADGNGPKGCVIFSPQLNGGDSLDSLIPPLLSAGINVMRFNPRGMWDDDQDYSIKGHLEDLHAAVAFLRQNGGQHSVPPGTGPSRPYQIDLDRIAVLGKSGGGGMMGWIAAAENPNLNTVIAVEPAMLRTLPPEYDKYFSDTKRATAGRIDTGKWLSELKPADRERLSMVKAAPRLVNKNVLLIASLDKDYLQNIHRPLVQSMEKAGAKRFSEVTLESGNSYFLTKRIALARLVISWLKNECGF
jgi:hypothetical protein